MVYIILFYQMLLSKEEN